MPCRGGTMIEKFLRFRSLYGTAVLLFFIYLIGNIVLHNVMPWNNSLQLERDGTYTLYHTLSDILHVIGYMSTVVAIVIDQLYYHLYECKQHDVPRELVVHAFCYVFILFMSLVPGYILATLLDIRHLHDVLTCAFSNFVIGLLFILIHLVGKIIGHTVHKQSTSKGM